MKIVLKVKLKMVYITMIVCPHYSTENAGGIFSLEIRAYDHEDFK